MTTAVNGTDVQQSTTGTGERPLLEIKDLTVEFATEDGVVRAVTGVDYDL